MARGQLTDIQSGVLDQVDDIPLEQEELDSAPLYAIIGEASIPVSKKAGARWQKLIDAQLEVAQPEHSKWERAYIEYRKCADELKDGKPTSDVEYHMGNDVDENMIRENVKLLLRNSYSRNPKIELSAIDPDDKLIARTLTKTLMMLFNRKGQPGLNAKPRVRRTMVHAHLTNFGILKVGFAAKEGSRQEGLQELERVREKLRNTKKAADLDELYGQLEQIEESLPSLHEKGLTLANVLPHRLILSNGSNYTDLLTTDWAAEQVYPNTQYLRTKYMEKGEDGKWTRKSDGKTVAKMEDTSDLSAESVKAKITNQVLGHTTEERFALEQKETTECWYIWDRLTKEVSLYMANDWTYPLYVWKDPYGLSRFYPYFILSYTEPLDNVVQPGETSQYIGHAREINRINRRIKYIRDLAFGAVFYNTRKVKGDSVKQLINFFKNPTAVDAIGIDWDVDTKFEDVVQVFVPPDAKIQELYNKADLEKSVDRINSQSAATRGDQFKTNTTNKAIEQYSAAQTTVTNELTDIIEDLIEELSWSLCELIVSKFTKEDIANLIGNADAKEFTPMEIAEFNTKMGLTVAAGSTEKPTSENKKKEAIGIAQALGQFGQGAPGTTMKIVLRMFEQAFSELQISSEDFRLLDQETAAMMQKGISTPGQQQPGAAPAQPQPGGPPAAPAA